MDNLVGRNIGRHQIVSVLGQGGMGTVYAAYDPNFQRNIAIKVLPPTFSHQPEIRARFEREARTIAALEHPTIVPVYDFGQENGQLYIVMRLLSGESLAERLNKGPLSLDEVKRILRSLASALDYAHSRGVIHRDLKPGNILFDEEENAFLSDFGIAKLVLDTSINLTGAGMVGTPAYMSPEQVQGDREIDGRSDIYSLGVLLFYMLAGELPFQADTAARLMFKHVTDPVPSLHNLRPDLPEGVDRVIRQAMAKSPDARFATAAALVDAFDALLVSGDNLIGKAGVSSREEVIKTDVVKSIPEAIAPKRSFLDRVREWIDSNRSKPAAKESPSKNIPTIEPVGPPAGEMTFNLIAALSPQSQKQIITLIGRDHEMRLKDAIVHFGGVRYLLR